MCLIAPDLIQAGDVQLPKVKHPCLLLLLLLEVMIRCIWQLLLGCLCAS